MKLFTWDDNECELTEREPFELFQCDAENGVEIIEWRYPTFVDPKFEPNRPICYVQINGRFWGFTLWAENAEEATRLLETQDEYVQYMKETE